MVDCFKVEKSENELEQEAKMLKILGLAKPVRYAQVELSDYLISKIKDTRELMAAQELSTVSFYSYKRDMPLEHISRVSFLDEDFKEIVSPEYRILESDPLSTRKVFSDKTFQIDLDRIYENSLGFSFIFPNGWCEFSMYGYVQQETKKFRPSV